MASMDRSLAFTVLCELHPTFAQLPAFGTKAGQLITDLVAAWERDQPKDRFAHARQWIAALPPDSV